MKLTDDYNAEIAKDFMSIKVGCQKIDIITIDSLVEKIEKDSGKSLKSLKKEREKQLKDKPKDIRDLIKTFEDACKHQKVDYNAFIKVYDSSFISASVRAIARLEIIIAALNENHVFDWDNSNEYKYYPYFRMGSSGLGFSYFDFRDWYSNSLVGGGLCLKTPDLAKYAGTQFLEEYRPYMLPILGVK